MTTFVRGIRLPTEIWEHYVRRADELDYPSVGPLVTEALRFYADKILDEMEPPAPEVQA
jgi:hypothetical protein